MDAHAATLLQLISRGEPDQPALSAPERTALTYRGLRALVAEVGVALAERGIGATDRVAIVLPNGPGMASAFVACANAAVAAPLNPAYLQPEFEFYLADLGAKAVIVQRGVATTARAAAAGLGIPLVELTEDESAPAGAFTLDSDLPGPPLVPAVPAPGDIALVLHTSGTTSRPKIVPLSHANLCASARHIGATLRLTADDHCLNLMPLFHIHGLVAALLSSLHAGGQVTCTPGFNAVKFFRWLEAARPTWFTAVPTMHQAIVERAPRNAAILEKTRLRFIRSSSAALPAPVMAQVEQTFNCPLVESFGMTEAAHQVASNPLPPAARKADSVGLPAGPDVRLMDATGRTVAPGERGEIVLRGANVMGGYENNPEANATAFWAGPGGGDAWFRTGDEGVFDADGYLFIKGRLKEIINRGGEKIAPKEVDDVLIQHAAVAQVVTFAIPHPKLGEDVAAAIVLKPDAACSEQEIRDFAAARLTAFKVPRKLVFLDEIPKGSTGKLQRIGLAQKLGLG